DATIVLRYASGIRGSALVAGLNLTGGSRSTFEAINAFIEGGCVAPIAARAPLYEALANTDTRDAFIEQADAQGARSFSYVGSIAVGTQANLYANEASGAYTYRSFDLPATALDFQTLANEQGAQRFRFGGFSGAGMYFVRDETSNRTFTYRVVESTYVSGEFLTQVNGQGAEGYYFVSPFLFGFAVHFIYAKESGNSTYEWTLQSATDQNAADLITQANTQGTNGYKFRTSFAFSNGTRNLYVKDTSQTATFAWRQNPNVDSVAALVTQANTEGAIGFVYQGARVFYPTGFSGPSDTRIIYFRPTNCAGSTLCSTGGSF
ncbi:MAG: hypothetical protein ACRDAM_00640, partial [Casimicrobium sp.]